MDDNVQFLDAEQFQGGGKDKISFRLIVLLHLQKISNFACVEFRGGYFTERYRSAKGGGGYSEQIYVPDSRSIYWNAVDYLHDILYPHFDKEMKEKSEEFDNEYMERYKEYKSNENAENTERKYQNFLYEKLKVKRKLFRELNCFLNRVKYMEGKVFEETL